MATSRPPKASSHPQWRRPHCRCPSTNDTISRSRRSCHTRGRRLAPHGVLQGDEEDHTGAARRLTRRRRRLVRRAWPLPRWDGQRARALPRRTGRRSRLLTCRIWTGRLPGAHCTIPWIGSWLGGGLGHGYKATKQFDPSKGFPIPYVKSAVEEDYNFVGGGYTKWSRWGVMPSDPRSELGFHVIQA